MMDDHARATILNQIDQNYYTGIRAGEQRETFISVWIVVVLGRIFARSWGFAERSWYNTFLQDPRGALKVDEDIIPIHAIIPKDLAIITEHINMAYINKFDSGRGSEYAKKIITAEHISKTMEFILDE